MPSVNSVVSTGLTFHRNSLVLAFGPHLDKADVHGVKLCLCTSTCSLPFNLLQFLLADLKDVLESFSSLHSYEGVGSKKITFM